MNRRLFPIVVRIWPPMSHLLPGRDLAMHEANALVGAYEVMRCSLRATATTERGQSFSGLQALPERRAAVHHRAHGCPPSNRGRDSRRHRAAAHPPQRAGINPVSRYHRDPRRKSRQRDVAGGNDKRNSPPANAAASVPQAIHPNATSVSVVAPAESESANHHGNPCDHCV